MPDAHANFAISQVAVAPSPALSGTTLTVGSGHGARFPTPPFNAPVWPNGALPTPLNAEIVRVSAIAGDVLTITRAQEGSSARSIVVGDQISAAITVKTLTDAECALRSLAARVTGGAVAANPGDLILAQPDTSDVPITLPLGSAARNGMTVGVFCPTANVHNVTIAATAGDSMDGTIPTTRPSYSYIVLRYVWGGGGEKTWYRETDATPDQAAAYASLRTIGTGPQQAAPGDFGGAWTAYSPAWTAATTNPILGTGGSITAAYKKLGKICAFRIFIAFGSGGAFNNGGVGAYSFGLPFAAAGSEQPAGQAHLWVPSAGNFFGAVLISAGASVATVWPPSSSASTLAGQMQATDSAGVTGHGVPNTGANYPVQASGNLSLSGVYETA